MREMQGAENEVEGSILKYVTETEFRKQRSRLRIFTHRLLRCVKMREMQGAEVEVEGSILCYDS